MHRTSGTILATSRNKEKTSFPSPLLHTGERVQHSNQSSTTASHRRRGPLSTASHRRKSLHWAPRYGKPHTTFNSTKSSSSKTNTSNIQHIKITYRQQSTHHHLTHSTPKFNGKRTKHVRENTIVNQSFQDENFACGTMTFHHLNQYDEREM